MGKDKYSFKEIEKEKDFDERVRKLSKAEKTTLVGLIMLLYSRVYEACEIISYLLASRGSVLFTDNEKDVHDDFVCRAKKFLAENL